MLQEQHFRMSALARRVLRPAGTSVRTTKAVHQSRTPLHGRSAAPKSHHSCSKFDMQSMGTFSVSLRICVKRFKLIEPSEPLQFFEFGLQNFNIASAYQQSISNLLATYYQHIINLLATYNQPAPHLEQCQNFPCTGAHILP